MNDLDLLGAADPATFTPSDEAREELLRGLRMLSADPERRRRRRRLAVLLGGGTALSLVGSGLAYAVLAGQPARTAMKINCAFGVTEAEFDRWHEFTNVLDTSTGDPVADCTDEFGRLEGYAPPLAAYDVGGEAIYVMPATWTAPAEWRRLAPTFRSDPVRLELKQRMGDLVDGPESRCSSADQAEAYARAQLADLGLTDYTIERLSQASWANGTTGCALAWVDDAGKPAVLIQGVDAQTSAVGDGPTARDIARRLRTWISDACVRLPQAENLARRAVTEAGFTVRAGQIRSIQESSTRCTSVDLLAAGDSVIVLRGPTG